MVGMVVGHQHRTDAIDAYAVARQLFLHDIGCHPGINQHPLIIVADIGAVARTARPERNEIQPVGFARKLQRRKVVGAKHFLLF